MCIRASLSYGMDEPDVVCCETLAEDVVRQRLRRANAYGDEGSDTLGNVARAVNGFYLANMEALGLGNVEPLVRLALLAAAGSPGGGRPSARAVEGQAEPSG